jgi:DNA-binding response OmpR family regulator
METGFIRILVVGDDASYRAHVSKILSYLGYTVFSTQNGQKGLDFFLKNQFDLIITDWDLSFLDDLDLSTHTGEKSFPTQVIIIADQAKETIQARIKDFPVDRILFEPFTLWDIEVTIQAALNQGLTERIA